MVIFMTIGLCIGGTALGGIAAAQSSDFEGATQISEGVTTGQVIDGSNDFYKFTANSTDAVDVRLTPESGDLEYRIYDPNRAELVGDGFVSGGTERLTIKAPETGTYYIEVNGNDGQTTTDYTLNHEIITPDENDDFAPNDDFDSAAGLREGFTGGTIWGGESDFYKFTANTTDAIDVQLTPESGELEYRIYDPSRAELIGDGFVSGGTGRLIIKAPETGTYYIEVNGNNRQTTTNYTLNHEIITPDENDDFAPNDDFDSAAGLQEGFTDGTIWGGESDFYEFTANTTDAIDVRLTPESGELEYRIYDPSRAELVGDGFVSGGTGRLTIKAPETGTYYIEVNGNNRQTTTDYTLNNEIITPDENDDFAPNDNFRSAAPITAEFSDGKLWGGESDYYRVGLNDSEGLNIALTPENSDMELYVYGPDREQIISDGFVPAGNADSLSIQADRTGNYYIEIVGDDMTTTSDYRIQSNQTGSFVEIVDANLDPSTVNDSQNTHTLSFRARGISSDDEKDSFEIIFPESVTLEDYSDVNINGMSPDIKRENNMLKFTVNPDDENQVKNIPVEMNVTLST